MDAHSLDIASEFDEAVIWRVSDNVLINLHLYLFTDILDTLINDYFLVIF
jgi:hypothetical protein